MHTWNVGGGPLIIETESLRMNIFWATLTFFPGDGTFIPIPGVQPKPSGLVTFIVPADVVERIRADANSSLLLSTNHVQHADAAEPAWRYAYRILPEPAGGHDDVGAPLPPAGWRSPETPFVTRHAQDNKEITFV